MYTSLEYAPTFAKLALTAVKQLATWMNAQRLAANVRRVAEPWRGKNSRDYADYDFVCRKFVGVLLTSYVKTPTPSFRCQLREYILHGCCNPHIPNPTHLVNEIGSKGTFLTRLG